MRGCKRKHRPSWADLTESDNTLAGVSEQKVFLTCWNMPLQADVLESWRRCGESVDVRTALQLPEAEWPGEILELVLLEVVQIGVPFAVGIPIEKYIADRFFSDRIGMYWPCIISGGSQDLVLQKGHERTQGGLRTSVCDEGASPFRSLLSRCFAYVASDQSWGARTRAPVQAFPSVHARSSCKGA